MPFRFVMLVAASVIAPTVAQAWHSSGHMAIARIAWKQMDDAQRVYFNNLLKKHPHYDVYLARYPAGRPWQSLLVLEYKGDRGLAARDATVARVRAKLKDNPKWKAISDSKKNVRVEKPPVIADPIAAR